MKMHLKPTPTDREAGELLVEIDLSASRELAHTASVKVKRRPPPRRRPVDPAEGPWLIRSHYWKRWHRRSSDGGACGYTDDIGAAGVFEYAKAREYHDWQTPGGRDEAVPVKRAAREMSARVIKMERESALLAERVAYLRGLVGAPT